MGSSIPQGRTNIVDTRSSQKLEIMIRIKKTVLRGEMDGQKV
jgi:hypothetical protein